MHSNDEVVVVVVVVVVVAVVVVVMVVVVVVVVIISNFVGTQRNIYCVTGCHHAARLNPNSPNTRIHH